MIAYLIYLLIGDTLFTTTDILYTLRNWERAGVQHCWDLKYTFTVGIYLYLLHKLHTEVKEERMVGPAM